MLNINRANEIAIMNYYTWGQWFDTLSDSEQQDDIDKHKSLEDWAKYKEQEKTI